MKSYRPLLTFLSFELTEVQLAAPGSFPMQNLWLRCICWEKKYELWQTFMQKQVSKSIGNSLARQSRQVTIRCCSHRPRTGQPARAGMLKGYQEACKLLDTIRPLPQLIVWDLDCTLWPFWYGCAPSC